MLHEIAITPDVFLKRGYATPELCDAHMQGLSLPLLEWCLIRNLRSGAWKKVIQDNRGEMSFYATQVWKGILKVGRLCTATGVGNVEPRDDQEWCQEAIDLHQSKPSLGILTTAATKRIYQQNREVAPVERRTSSAWWQSLEAGHPDGPTTGRRLVDYHARMLPILGYARSLIFIDPHLDPDRPGYASFLDLIEPAIRRPAPKPLIEVHRCCYEGSGPQRRIIQKEEWERRFRDQWSHRLKRHACEVKVFIWSDLHDRHLLSDLIGVHVGNGFDTSNDPNKTVCWTRVSAQHRDELQRAVDPAVNGSHLIHQFAIR